MDLNQDRWHIKRDTPPQNENGVINHLPPYRSKPIKASFLFGTQFKILDKNREA